MDLPALANSGRARAAKLSFALFEPHQIMITHCRCLRSQFCPNNSSDKEFTEAVRAKS